MEYIVINGEPVPIPNEIVSQGRDAVAAYVLTLVPSTPKAAPAARQE